MGAIRTFIHDNESDLPTVYMQMSVCINGNNKFGKDTKSSKYIINLSMKMSLEKVVESLGKLQVVFWQRLSYKSHLGTTAGLGVGSKVLYYVIFVIHDISPEIVYLY